MCRSDSLLHNQLRVSNLARLVFYMEACDLGRTASWDGGGQLGDSVIHQRNMNVVMNISSAITFFTTDVLYGGIGVGGMSFNL